MHKEDENSAKITKELQPKANAMVTLNQLKKLIKETIKYQVESVSQLFYTYAKPYYQRIDCLRMPSSY